VKLNCVEKAAMNNPIRAFIQRHYEAAMLLRLGGPCEDANALEIGCGRGVGVQLILERFRAKHVDAFDLDPGMISLASTDLPPELRSSVTLSVGDVTEIDAPDAYYDAVFDFGIIHHVPDWRRAVTEVTRVLRSGGRFYFEEVTRKALNRWATRTLTRHPTEDRFTGDQFMAELRERSIEVGNRFQYFFFNDFFAGVGIKA
jgi:ubiquinone/menaquinone biosynthesis C-methylase UbiE